MDDFKKAIDDVIVDTLGCVKQEQASVEVCGVEYTVPSDAAIVAKDIDKSMKELQQLGREGNFRKELEELINRHSMESGSNTPDFILADYLMACLRAFDFGVKARQKHCVSRCPNKMMVRAIDSDDCIGGFHGD